MTRRTSTIRKSVVLLASVAALAAPTAAAAYPIIGDDPTTAESQAQGHDWYTRYLRRQAARLTPSTARKPPHWPCPYNKRSCPTP